MKPIKHPFVTRTLTCVLIAAGSLHASLTSHAESISPEEAHAIGVEAYVYFYSLVTMDITRKQLTNVERARGYQRANEHLRELSCLSDGGYESSCPA